MSRALLGSATSWTANFKRVGGALLDEYVTGRIVRNLSGGTAARSLGGPIQMHRVILGTAKSSDKGPPLSSISLFMVSMLREGNPKLNTS